MAPFHSDTGKAQDGTRFSSASSERAPRPPSHPQSIVDRDAGLTLDPQTLLILDDEVLLGLLQLLQLVLRVLCDEAQLLKRLVDLKVLLGHGVSKTSSWRAPLGKDEEI